MKIIRTILGRAVPITSSAGVLFLALAFGEAPSSFAQNLAQSQGSQKELASVNEAAQPLAAGPTKTTTTASAAANNNPSASQPANSSAASDVPAAVAQELAAMESRIEELEAALICGARRFQSA